LSAHDFNLLVVDDEELNRDMLSRRLQREGYRVDTAVDGEHALAQISRADYDLVLLDIMMPKMDGFEVLERLRADRHTVPIIMLTAVNERSDVLRCLGLGANDYVVKPFDMQALKGRIKRCLSPDITTDPALSAEAPELAPPDGASSLVVELARSLSKGDFDFPVLPTVAFKAVEVARQEHADLSDLAEILKSDPALAARVVQRANSSAYRGSRVFKTVEDAVARIGLKQTADYVLAVTTASMFNAEAPLYEALLQRLWHHSLSCALAAKFLAERTQGADPDLLFMMGLLHDIGKLVLLKILMELPRTRNAQDDQQINDVLDALHGEFGGALLHRWHFDEAFVDVAKLHHNDEDIERCALELRLVALANRLTELGDDGGIAADDSIERLCQVSGIHSDELPAITAEVRQQFAEMQIAG